MTGSPSCVRHAWCALQVLKMSGLDGLQTVFLFSDTQVVHEYFLEDINNILNRGEVPNIFDPSDMDLITAAMRPVNQQLGLPLDKTALYAQFLKRVQANIHICLAMSPIGEAFRSRLRMFPSLVNCCTLDWFTEWPDEALQSVAQEAFSTVYFANGEQIEGDEEGASKSTQIKNSIALTAMYIHQSVSTESKRFLAEERRHNHVTPTSYLELLAIFKVLLAARRTELGTAKRRLTVGLDKLQTTEKEVKLLQDTLEKNQPVLIKTTKEVEEMMVSISADKAGPRTLSAAAFCSLCRARLENLQVQS
jgi:dynein heavy chain